MTNDTMLAPHFSLGELVFSPTAQRLGIDNSAPPDIEANLRRLALTLEAVRAVLQKPMHIDSGYRCPRLNAAVGGARDSAHLHGWAADFVAPNFGDPRAVCLAIIAAGVRFDQLIFEQTWTHISVDPAMRGQVLTAHFDGRGRASYIPGMH